MRRATQNHKETSAVSRPQPRTRDEKKSSEANKQKVLPPEESSMETSKTSADDVYEFKSVKESDSSPDNKTTDPLDVENNDKDPLSSASIQTEEPSKRNFSEVDTTEETVNDDESRRKKRKDENTKETKAGASQRGTGQNKTQSGKQSNNAQGKSSGTNVSKGGTDKKSPCASPKPASVSDAEVDEGKSDLKVPPLKIVIPQSSTNEQEAGQTRNGKNSSQRTQALPYVVASSNNDNGEKDTSGGTTSPVENAGKQEDKKEVPANSSDEQATVHEDTETSVPVSTSSTPQSTPAPVELHPRKRKMKPNKETPAPSTAHDNQETPTLSEMHPHEQPITNCYQLFLNIRKQIEKRRKGLFPVQPKPPQGFKDYLMNRCTYVLAGNSPTTPNITYPATLPAQMKDLFAEQEKERYKLRMQHVIEKEKLVLSVEQEILRVHGKAARALANQSLPFSVCTILRDEEIYNLITPEQEEKDRNARSRYNGRLFLSWLQDVDDKWEKIKEHMLLRHHNEAESLNAVQKMNWEWKLKELNLCDAKTTPNIEELHVPMVHVSDDFDLLPA